jgi:uncharacterized protein YbjT (DUF2867 family)
MRGDPTHAGEGRTALVTGATGFIGGKLADALAARGWRVRCLVRNPDRAGELEERGFEVRVGDVLDAASLEGAGEGAEVAYYLVHSMGRGGSGDFEEREHRTARNFAEMAKRDGVGRTVYLGGLGDEPRSKHLRSRQRTAELLAEHGPPLVYFRAGMVVGAGSESYRTLRYLVQRLPAMIAPAWLKTATQPIAVDDVIEYLATAPDVLPGSGGEIQIGGPDVLSYGDMLDRMAEALGIRPRRRIPVPLLTPWLSSLWIGLVTPVDAGVARPLVEGLSTPTVVTDPSGMSAFDIAPTGINEALRVALADDPEVGPIRRVGVRLLPEDAYHVPATGPVESTNKAEYLVPESAQGAPRPEEIEDLGRGYWSFVARHSLGLIRATEADGGRIDLFLRGTRLNLLRFDPPRCEPEEGGGTVTWPIAGGALALEGEDGRGLLRFELEQTHSDRGATTLRATMEVRGFYPLLRGRGAVAPLGARFYSLTQRVVHRAMTRAYLRSLGRRPPGRAHRVLDAG